MKKTLLLFIGILFTIINLTAQVGIGTTNPDASALLELNSTDAGLLIPKMTEAQRDLITSPATGLLIFQTDNSPGFYYYTSSTWTSFANDVDWTISGDDMYNANVGNIGIGTTAPSTKLHIEGASSSTTVLDDGFEDNNLAPFTSSGSRTWETTNNAPEVNTGTYAARTRTALLDNESSTLEYAATLVSNGTLSFAVTTSTESGWDELTFYIDGAAQTVWSGITPYTTVSYPLTSGAHTLTWTYLKDSSFDGGLDRVAIDDVLIVSTTGGSVLRIVDGSQASGYVLASDANGNASWADPSGTISDGDWTVTGANMVNANSGNVGVGVGVPTSLFHAEGTEPGNSIIYAENFGTTLKETYGVHGVTNSVNDIGSSGVFGESVTFGDHEIGVKGDYAFWGAAVAGIGWATDEADMPTTGSAFGETNDMGVYGGANFPTAIGIYGLNYNVSTGFAGYFDGNHAITGTKSASIPTKNGNQLVYAMESPEIWFEDFGQATLINGTVHITFDELYSDAVFIDGNHPMHVFLQEQGDCNGLFFIPDSDGKGFTVKEKQHGNSNITFSYRVTAKRRFFQDHRFGLDPLQPFENNLAKTKYVKPRTKNISEMKAIISKARQEKESKRGSTSINKKIKPTDKKSKKGK
ncbi:MAG: hypothetical protein KUG68_04545 [Flavobacteriaceae bacterium]|nr:hypothetical protein [Flavobacteriaceae bacterium]